MIRPLFVIGSSRSGTTALTDYLNQHEEILICRERYKRVPEQIDPSLLTYDRILDYKPQRRGGETNIPREHHVELLDRKNPAKLKWIGDKQPAESRRYRAISENNPGAHFLITYRPIEEVVESFEDRTKELDNPVFGGKDGVKMGVAEWNRAMTSAREYLETYDEPNGLIISYHDFFYRKEDYVPLLSEFLEIDFDDSILEAWANTSREFENRRRKKEPTTEAKAKYINENKDHDVDEWMLERIARQWSEPGLYKQSVGRERSRQKLAAALANQLQQERADTRELQQLERRSKQLEAEMRAERKRVKTAGEKHRNLNAKMEAVRSSRSWELLTGIGLIRSAIRRSIKR